MASSRGRAVLAEKKQKKTFAFGSSTPRELSYINTVPPRLRVIDGTKGEKGAKKEASPANGSANGYAQSSRDSEEPQHNISYYMRMARSLTPKRNAEKSNEAAHKIKCWAFGSSTPREFSHLNKIKPELRVYDAKIVIPPEERSQTMPDVAQFHPKPHRPPLPKPIETRKSSVPKQVKKRIDIDAEDEIASEPDMVQDRGQDFDEFIRQYQMGVVPNGHAMKNGSDGSDRTQTPEPTIPEPPVYEKSRVDSFLDDLSKHTQEEPAQAEILPEAESHAAREIETRHQDEVKPAEEDEAEDKTPRGADDLAHVAENVQEHNSPEIVQPVETTMISTEPTEAIHIEEEAKNESESNPRDYQQETLPTESQQNWVASTSDKPPYQEGLNVDVQSQIVESPRPESIQDGNLRSDVMQNEHDDIDSHRGSGSESPTSRRIHYKNGQNPSPTNDVDIDRSPKNETNVLNLDMPTGKDTWTDVPSNAEQIQPDSEETPIEKAESPNLNIFEVDSK